MWYVPHAMVAIMFCCGMCHNMVLWYVPYDMVVAVCFAVLCSTRGQTAKGVVTMVPSLVLLVLAALCGNALTSLCSLNLLIHLDPAVSGYGFFWVLAHGGWWAAICICLHLGVVPHC